MLATAARRGQTQTDGEDCVVPSARTPDDSPPPTVRPYPLPDDLPAGQGGLAIHSRQRDGFPAPMIGVDGRPVLREFGDAVVVLPPGPHIVEVQLGEPVRS